jgi:hypothetical protein
MQTLILTLAQGGCVGAENRWYGNGIPPREILASMNIPICKHGKDPAAEQPDLERVWKSGAYRSRLTLSQLYEASRI